MALLQAKSVKLAFKDGDSQTLAVRGVTLEIPERQCLGILGPSGSGKSSLLYLLSGLRVPTEGDVYFEGRRYRDISEPEFAAVRRRKFGFVFQQHFLLNYLTAIENVLVATQSPQSNQTQKMAYELLTSLGLEDKTQRLPHQLSGGERQRVAVARAMVSRPKIIFADEPTGLLDSVTGRQVMQVLLGQRAQGNSLVVVSHDPNILAEADRVIEMRDGVIVNHGKSVLINSSSAAPVPITAP